VKSGLVSNWSMAVGAIQKKPLIQCLAVTALMEFQLVVKHSTDFSAREQSLWRTMLVKQSCGWCVHVMYMSNIWPKESGLEKLLCEAFSCIVEQRS